MTRYVGSDQYRIVRHSTRAVELCGCFKIHRSCVGQALTMSPTISWVGTRSPRSQHAMSLECVIIKAAQQNGEKKQPRGQRSSRVDKHLPRTTLVLPFFLFLFFSWLHLSVRSTLQDLLFCCGRLAFGLASALILPVSDPSTLACCRNCYCVK